MSGRKGVSPSLASWHLGPARVAPIYWSYAAVNVVMGVYLMLAPDEWFGATWRYFPQIPENGFWMGVTCVVIGIIQELALWRRPTAFLLSILFGLSAFVYWAAGCILTASGLLGDTGMASAPFILVIGAHKFIHSASLMAYHREAKRRGEIRPIDGEPFTAPPPVAVAPPLPDHEEPR